MTKMRAKYKVDTVTITDNQSEIIKLSAVTTGNREDNTFHKYTPYGNMDITITNPALLDTIKPGEEYYLDFTLAVE